MKQFVDVVLDEGLEKALEYEAISEAPLRPGLRVQVPVGKSIRFGTIIASKNTQSFPKVRAVSEILPEEDALPPALFQLALFMARYYCTSLGRILRLMLPQPIRQHRKAKEVWFVSLAESKDTLAELCKALRQDQPKLAGILDILLQSPRVTPLRELLKQAKTTKPTVEKLVALKAITLKKMALEQEIIDEFEYFRSKAKTLSEEQNQTFEAINKDVQAKRFKTHLIQGVTGSGKTEVYLQLTQEALALGKSVLILVPEVALTSQLFEKFRARFHEKVAVVHYQMKPSERYDLWKKMRDKTIRLAIGARSALFSPLQDIGLIIVDEEHEGAYKQEEMMPYYHARDMAIMRGSFETCPVVLGSATPSFETMHHALNGKYERHILKTRAGGAIFAKVVVVDMRPENEKQKRTTLFSDRLISDIQERVKKGEQILLFLNRRGYHTRLVCLSCGEAVHCPHCSVTLSFHKSDSVLVCHLCGYEMPPPKVCPHCRSQESLKFRGFGTEQVERAIYALFPDMRVLRLDTDTAKKAGSHQSILKAFATGKADLLIGTQMVTKGLHFPQVTLVGVINADQELQIPDFRAGELTFQKLTQVAGRSGRGALSGEVVIQTTMPENPVIQYAAKQDFDRFYEEEILSRQALNYPPFCRLVKLLWEGENEHEVFNLAGDFREELIKRLPPSAEVLAVMPASYAKIKDLYRFQCLIKCQEIQAFLKIWHQLPEDLLAPFNRAKIHFKVDVDPLIV